MNIKQNKALILFGCGTLALGTLMEITGLIIHRNETIKRKAVIKKICGIDISDNAYKIACAMGKYMYDHRTTEDAESKVDDSINDYTISDYIRDYNESKDQLNNETVHNINMLSEEDDSDYIDDEDDEDDD